MLNKHVVLFRLDTRKHKIHRAFANSCFNAFCKVCEKLIP